MKNKYKEFIESMYKSQDENIITNCNSLISSVKMYYSTYKQYENLKSLKNSYKKYSDTSIDKISIIENYLILKCYKCIKDTSYELDGFSITFRSFLDDYVYSKNYLTKKGELLLFEEYPTLKTGNYENLIKKSILKYRKLHKSKSFNYDYVQDRLNSIEKCIDIYNKNKDFKLVDEETAFNMLLSTEFVEDLISDIKTNSSYIAIKIAPIRGILTDRNPKNNCHSYSFNSSIDKPLEILKNDNRKTILKFKKYFKCIKTIDSHFEKINLDFD